GVLFAIGLIVWQVKAGRAGEVNLSPEDMSLIAQDQQPQIIQRLSSDEAYRKDFAKNLKQMFAVAEQARKDGYGNRPEMKRRLEWVRTFVISQNHLNPKGGPGGPPQASNAKITDADIDAVFKEKKNEDQFQAFIKDALARSPGGANQQ